MAVNDLKELQRRMNTQSLRDNAQMVQGIPARGQAPMATQQAPMMQQQAPMMPPQAPPSSLNAILKKRVMDKDGTETDLLTEITEAFIDRMPEPEEEVAPVNLQSLGMNALGFNPATATPQDRGLIGMAAGGGFSGKVPGQGHGMEDNVYMPIVERQAGQQVATLAVSPDEYVVDAHTMSALGNGNADEGARYMDSMVKNIRQKAFGTDQQPNEINGLAALRPMIERV
tara:strand:- start:988 stop:1671 length:684 start_codon:yes stop_codon:yes gene_type:complete